MATGPAQTVLEKRLSGTILLRGGGDEEPLAKYEGDKHCDYFLVPENTTRLHARLEWDSPQPIALEVDAPGGQRHATWDYQSAPPTSPSELELSDPGAGEWTYWIGPGVAGANIPWRLTLTWTIERANATLAETEQTARTDLPCVAGD